MPLTYKGSETRSGNPTWAFEVGKALRAHRESIITTTVCLGATYENRMSQVQAAILSGFAQSAVSEIECGIKLRPQDYITYAHALGADLEIRFRNDEAGKTRITFNLTKKEGTP